MVGYYEDGTAYRIYDVETGNVVISRDVKFNEDAGFDDLPDNTSPSDHDYAFFDAFVLSPPSSSSSSDSYLDG